MRRLINFNLEQTNANSFVMQASFYDQ